MATDLERALARYYDDPAAVSLLTDTGLGALRLSGAGFSEVITEAVTSASLDLSTGEVSQFKCSVEDPGALIFDSGLFRRGQELAYFDLRFTITTLDFAAGGGLGGLGLAATSAGAQRMREDKFQPWLVRDTSATAFVGLMAAARGCGFVGEATPVRPQVGRKEDETSWEAAARLAKEEGHIVFESCGLVVMGRPSWLINQTPRANVGWSPSGAVDAGWPPDTVASFSVPDCHEADASGDRTVKVTLPPRFGRRIRPGQGVALWGRPLTFNGVYYVTSVGAQLSLDGTVSVSLAAPIDPTPEPDTSGDVSMDPGA